jgi:hypothetical protein
MKLRPIDRAAIVHMAWQAECAKQDNAAHLVHSYPMPSGDAAAELPETVKECMDMGARLLREHLEHVTA